MISAAEVEHGQLLDITTEIDVIWHVYENAAPNRDPPLLYAPRDNKPPVSRSPLLGRLAMGTRNRGVGKREYFSNYAETRVSVLAVSWASTPLMLALASPKNIRVLSR